MARITLFRKPFFRKMYLPLWVFINGQPLGLMRGESVTIELPQGSYNVGVKLLFQFWKLRFGIGGSSIVTATEEVPARLEIRDRERIWNIVYYILSDGFFLLWIIRLILIRNRYYQLTEK